jgi:hypothetical protein
MTVDKARRMKTVVVSLLAAAVLLLAVAFYRSRPSGPRLNVEPHAREVIEKAKKR